MSNNNTKEVKKHRHLSLAEREEITIGLSKGLKISKIAQMLNRSACTISREIKRNSPSTYKVWYRAGRR
jgi:IS30 family transposase